ncbi:MAG TPA: DNA polymerase III subunit delta [Acidiferrobacterales bacterium]|nr:DNA polymerase III subunit delta [Acidiferrobacterales bacterium]
MQINADQLARQLERGLAPLYLVSGDEPLQVDECGKAIRRRAENAGCNERCVFTAGPGFDWDGLRTATQSLSLFAERRLIELNLSTGRPGEAGAALLAELAENVSSDIVLLVITGKLDKAQRESHWVKAMEAAGTHVVIWPLDAQKLPAWLAQRFAARGLQPEAGVIDLLAWHLEGNMLAAAQEVDKLAMLCGAVQGRTSAAGAGSAGAAAVQGPTSVPHRDVQMPRAQDAQERPAGAGSAGAADGRVGLAEVEESLADSARFSIYQLVDAALAGEVAAARRILASLRADGTEPILILWALARELRSLAQMGQELARGKPESSVLARAWAQRRTLVGKALRRHPASVWLGFVRRGAQLDRILKGRESGDLWLELERLLLAVAGLRPFVMDRTVSETSA